MEDWYAASMPLLLFSPGVLLLCAITAFIASRTVSRKRVCEHLPPGPRGLPIIGHLHLLGQLPHRSLCEMSKVHGPLMSLRLGSVPVVVVSSPEMAQQVLQTHDHAFANRMPTAAARHIFGAGMDIAFSQPNAYWKLMRRLFATRITSPHGMQFFKPVRMEETRLMVRSVLADCKVQSGRPQPQQMRAKLEGLTSDIMMRMMIGKRFCELSGKQEQGCSSGKVSVVELIEETFALLGVYNVGDYLPFVAWMDLQGCERRSKRLAADLRAAFEEIIEARRLDHREDGRPPKDYLDMLLQAAATSDDMPIHIMEVILQCIIGGTHTSALTVEWALADLLSNPEKMRRVQGEMDQVVGMKRTVQEDDIGNLPFLQACVKETMRLHPVGPLLVPHQTNQDLQIWGFQIPTNTLALVNTWAIGRDPKVWADPATYCPERFLQARNVDVNGHHFELLPFGSGRRQCPGWKLGLVEVHTILASLLQGFSWSIPPSHRLDMSERFRLDLCLAAPLVACATPRLPMELF